MTALLKPPCDEGVIQAAPPPAPTAKPVARAGLWILVATILGSSLSFIDGTVVNVALPTIQRDLRATGADVQWVIEAYALFLAALILVGGSLGDRLGRRRVFVVGSVVFTLASVACGLAPTLLVLIIARAAQGIGGALLVPGSLAIISASFEPERRGRAIGAWAGFTTITSALGPVLGGWLVESTSWRWVFFINVPLAALTLLVTFWHVPESRDEGAAGSLDWWGAALATLGLGALVYGLIESSALGLGAPQVLAALAIGVVALVGFVLVEARSAEPMMRLDLFRSRDFSGANLLTLLLYGGLGGAFYFLPFNLQQVQGYSPAEAGAALLPLPILVFSLSRWAGGLINRYGAKLPLVVGPIIAATGFILFALPGIGGSYWLTYFPAVVVLSLGMAIVIAPLTTTVMNAVSAEHAGVASGVNNAVSRTAGLIAIAALNLVVVFVFNSALDTQLAKLPIPAAVRQALDAQRSRLAGAQAPASGGPALQHALQQAIGAAYVSGFRVAMLTSAALALAAAGAAALLIAGKGTRQTAPPAVEDAQPPRAGSKLSAAERPERRV